MLHLAYDLADFELVRAHWTGYFVRECPPGAPVRALMARVLHQIRAAGHVVCDYLLNVAQFNAVLPLPIPPSVVTGKSGCSERR